MKNENPLKRPDSKNEICLGNKNTAECKVCDCHKKTSCLSLDFKKEDLNGFHKLKFLLGLCRGQKNTKKADYIYIGDTRAAVVELKKINKEDLKVIRAGRKQIAYTRDHHVKAFEEDYKGEFPKKDIKGILIVRLKRHPREDLPPWYWKNEILWINKNNSCIKESEFLSCIKESEFLK